MQLKTFDKQEQTKSKSKSNRWQIIIKLREEISEIKTNKKIEYKGSKKSKSSLGKELFCFVLRR